MSDIEKRSIAEALILASPDPIPLARLAKLIPRCTPAKARGFVDELNAEYLTQQRAFEICEVSGGYQMRTLSEFASYLQQLRNARPLRLSSAALETLAIVAYRQPLTRAEVENVRGVDAGPVMRSLLERKLIKLAGHREVPGRPMLYKTTKRFLELFGLAELEDLPTLRELDELVLAASDTGDAFATDENESLAAEIDAHPDSPSEPGVSLEDVEIVGKPH
jgi:segregation and condensation protein B